MGECVYVLFRFSVERMNNQTLKRWTVWGELASLMSAESDRSQGP